MAYLIGMVIGWNLILLILCIVSFALAKKGTGKAWIPFIVGTSFFLLADVGRVSGDIRRYGGLTHATVACLVSSVIIMLVFAIMIYQELGLSRKRLERESLASQSDRMESGNKEDGGHLPNKEVPASANVGTVSANGNQDVQSSNPADSAPANGGKTTESGKLDIKYPPYIVSETGKVLYALEHRVLREQFYQNPELVVRAALSKEDFLYDLYCFVAKNEGQQPECGRDVFKMSPHRQNSDINLIMFELPIPMYTPLCFRIYLFYSDDYSKLGYYTIERGLSGDAILCEWTRDAHGNYGEAKGAIWPEGREAFFKALEAAALIELFAKKYGLSKEAEKPAAGYAPSGIEGVNVSEQTAVHSEDGLLPEDDSNSSKVKEEERMRRPNTSGNSDGRNSKKAPPIQRAGDLE